MGFERRSEGTVYYPVLVLAGPDVTIGAGWLRHRAYGRTSDVDRAAERAWTKLPVRPINVDRQWLQWTDVGLVEEGIRCISKGQSGRLNIDIFDRNAANSKYLWSREVG